MIKKIWIPLATFVLAAILTFSVVFMFFLRPLSKEKSVLSTALTDTENNLNKANDKNENLVSELKEVKADVLLKQQEIEAAQEEIEKSKANLEKINEDLENSKTELENSKAELESSKADLEKSESDLGKTKTDLTRANNRVAKANQIAAQLKIYDNQSTELVDILNDLYAAIDNNNEWAYNSAYARYENMASKVETTYDNILRLIAEFENI